VHQLRWNALLKQWVVLSTHRQGRPQMPADWCPFCPGSGNVPDNYDVFLYPNDFPGFRLDADPFYPQHDNLFAITGPKGACDVVLYSPNHTLPPSKLSPEDWLKVIGLWERRITELTEHPEIAYISAFENCGEAIGVTMPHPHGQIYAMPFIPPTIRTEVDSCTVYTADHAGACLFCDLLKKELQDAQRIVAQNNSFVAFVPFAARFPAEIVIYSRRHVRLLTELTDAEKADLASVISIIRKKYDNLYGFLLPLMMLMKQAPVQTDELPYHFHMQFLPLQRSATKLKYLASFETGLGSFLADTSPEDMAAKLRETEPATAV
jgi:UDPglucose--hexose-1-phosphate uridylyltransferase